MGSKLLPQALVTMPANHQHHQLRCGIPKSLSFSTHSPLRFSAITIPSFNSTSKRSQLRPFLARAEPESQQPEPELPETVEETDAPSESEPQVVDESSEAEPRPPRKIRAKLGDIMGILNNRAVEASLSERPIPDIRTGDVVQIKLEVPENKRRLSVYKGIVISRQNAGIHTTIRIRRIIAGIGVEIVFPLYSPNIKELKVVSHRKVRKARLYYLRDKLPRLSTFK